MLAIVGWRATCINASRSRTAAKREQGMIVSVAHAFRSTHSIMLSVVFFRYPKSGIKRYADIMSIKESRAY
jgi:hypothetical protein